MRIKKLYSYPWFAIEKPLNLLIQVGLDAQDSDLFKTYIEKKNIQAALNELCTLHIRGPRRAGHSRAIFTSIKKFKFNRVAILLHNQNQIDGIIKHSAAKNL